MKKLLLCLLLCSSGSPIFGQEPTIEEQVKSYPPSKSILISNARNLLLDCFVENDTAKITAVTKYIISLEDNDYVGLYDGEKLLAYFLAQQYAAIFNQMKSIVSDYEIEQRVQYSPLKIYPPRDQLFYKAKEIVTKKYRIVEEQIQASELSDEDKDFLVLTLKTLLIHEAGYPIDSQYYFSQDEINSEANFFLSAYPNSIYSSEVKKIIRNEYKEGKWGGSWDFYSGYGIVTSTLSDTYKNPIPLGFSLDLSYANFILRGYVTAGFSSLKKDMDYSIGTWEKGETMSFFNAGANIGYNVFDSKLLKVSPYAGVGYMSVGVPEKDKDDIPELKELKVNSLALTLGASIEFKLARENWRGAEKGYLLLRLSYSYHSLRFKSKYAPISGDMHYITLGFGMFGRNIVKVQ